MLIIQKAAEEGKEGVIVIKVIKIKPVKVIRKEIVLGLIIKKGVIKKQLVMRRLGRGNNFFIFYEINFNLVFLLDL